MRAAVVENQRRTYRGLVAAVRPLWRSDPAWPGRLEALLRGDRRFGSRDRRLYRELVYTAVRFLPWVEPWFDLEPDWADRVVAWLAAEIPATLAYRRAWAGDWPSCPPTVAGREQGLAAQRARARGGSGEPLPSVLPSWAERECPAMREPAQVDALHRRAPLWIRLRAGEPAAVLAEFSARRWPWTQSEAVPGAVRVDAEADLTTTDGFKQGAFEVQDAGSQRVLLEAAPEPGGNWLDACAGAGGKTLQLAQLLGPDGRIDACDIRSEALDEMSRRSARAGVASRIRRVGTPDPKGYDGVLVDAPCSGSGTWRRSPQLKWTTTPELIGERAEFQASLLGRFGSAVRPGGRLIYATCSLCARENDGVVRRFAKEHPAFRLERPGRLLLPAEHDGDGFFVASFRRTA